MRSEKAVEVRESRWGSLDDPGLEGCRYGWWCTIGEGNAIVSAIGGENVVSITFDVGDEAIELLRSVESLDVDGARTSVDTVFDRTYLNCDGDAKGVFKGLRNFLRSGGWRSIGDDKGRHCLMFVIVESIFSFQF